MNDCCLEMQQKLVQAEAQCAAMREVLEELSCLGSRNGRGNSIGNDIASRMLDKTDAGAAMLARMKRMEDALREISNVTSKCLSHEEMKDKMKKIAKAALEDKP